MNAQAVLEIISFSLASSFPLEIQLSECHMTTLAAMAILHQKRKVNLLITKGELLHITWALFFSVSGHVLWSLLTRMVQTPKSSLYEP